MSHYPSPQVQQYHYPPPTQAPRNRRSERNKRSGRSKKKTRLFAPWQVAVLILLCVLITASALCLSGANGKLFDLRAQRQKLIDEYNSLVSRHEDLLNYDDYIEYYAAYYEINPAFVAAVIYRESHYDPLAVSSVGARGLMQLMPDTVDWMADKLDIQNPDPHDPETNIRMGTRYLNYLSSKFDGNPLYVACAFHAGAGNVESWIEKGYFSDPANPTVDEIPMEDSKSYARKVIESYAVYLQHVYPDGGAAIGADAVPAIRAGVGGR